MAMAVVGRASILVTPSFTGFQKTVAKQMPKQGKKAGGSLGSSLMAGLKRAAAPIAIGGIVTSALVKGFNRLKGIEEAQAKLRGLGHDAKAVEGIMKDALASVKGTAFGMDEAATTAAGAVAAGIKPGKELERYLKLTADAATIAGTSMGEMGSIINKTTTAGKVQADNLNQLADRGIPIFQWLAKEYGVSATELSKMVSQGKVDAETFRKVIEENIGGAALESGNTTTGAFKNMGAALGRVGANLLEGIFPMFQKVFSGIIDALEPIEGVAKNLGVTLGRYVIGAFESLQAAWPTVKEGLLGIKDAAAPIIPALRDIGAALLPLIPNLSGAGHGFSLLKGAVSAVSSVLSGVATFARENGTAFRVLVGAVLAGVAAFKAYQTVMAAQRAIMATYKAVQAGLTLGTYGLTGATYAQGTAQKVGAVASGLYNTALGLLSKSTRSATLAQIKLNLAMIANPIGIVVVAIAALVAGLIIAYNKSETFRNIVNTAFRTVAAAGLWLWNNALKPAFNAIVAAFQAVGGWIQKVWRNYISPVFQLIGAVIGWLWKNIAMPYFKFISTAFQVVGTVIKAVWTGFISPVFQLIGAIIKFLWNTIAKPIFGFIGAAFRAMGAVVQLVWRAVIKPQFDALAAIIRFLWANVAKPVFGFIQNRFRELGTAIRVVWANVVKPVFDALKSGVSKVGDAFRAGVAAIKKHWDKISAIAKKPVKFVIETIINNGLIGGFNKLAKVFGTDPITPIRLPKGFDTGGFTGNIDPSKVAGVVHGREWVINADSSGRFERRFPGFLKHINDTGTLPGYKGGGQVQPVPGKGNRHTTGYPWATWAGDFPNPMGTPVKAWKDGIVAMVKHLTTSYGKHVRMNHDDGTSSLYAHLSKIVVAVGQRLAAGDLLGNVGSTGNSTGPHLHAEFMGGPYKAKDGGGFDLLGMISDMVSGPLGKLKELGNNPFGQLITGAGKHIGTMFKDKAASLFTGVMDKVAGVGKSLASGAWAPILTTALKMNGLPLSLLDNWIRQVASESGGNPRAIQQVRDVNWPHNRAQGLLQVIPPTFAAYRSKILPNDPFNPLANAFAAMNYAKNRYSNLEAVIGHGHGYDSGGYLQPGYTLAYNGTNRPEPVFTNQQWKTLEQRDNGGPQVAFYGDLHGLDKTGVAAEFDKMLRRREALRTRVGV